MQRGVTHPIVLLGLVLAPLFAQAEATSPHWPLKQIFGRDAAVMQLDQQGLAEVCPDNDCVRFVLEGKNTVEIAHDFAYLYLWLVEGYDLADKKSPSGERFLATIFNRRKGTCAGEDAVTTGRCILAHMAAAYTIVGIQTRYVDGWNRRSRLDIPAALRRSGIP